MKYTNIISIGFFGLSKIASLLLKVFSGSETLVNFYRWSITNANYTQDQNTLVTADYYNGSENDIINIFKELEHLSTEGHSYHFGYLLKRLNFLAKEGLNFTYGFNLPTYRKLSEEEVNSVILSLRKAAKPKRDKRGRFSSKKK
jgi:hypothetical protein